MFVVAILPHTHKCTVYADLKDVLNYKYVVWPVPVAARSKA